MLRKHFAMSGDNKPDFTITYHAPKHVPFFGGYAKNWVYGYPNYENGLATDENPIKFKVIGDKWNDGVGEWKFKLADSSNKTYNSIIIGKKIGDLNDDSLIIFAGFGSADSYYKYGFDENDNIIQQVTVNDRNTITSVIFGEGIETINGSILSTVENQSSCTEITLPESVTQLIGNLFDYYISLKTITVPQNVIRIDTLCDIDLRNSLLEEIILKPLTPPDASNARDQVPFGQNHQSVKVKIRVYADAIDNYKNDSIWGQYSDLYDTINDTIVYYTDSGSRELYIENQDITTINSGMRPSGISSRSITNVYLPNSVTSIGNEVFQYCSSLTSITIGNSVTSIGDYAFYECKGLTSITIPNSVTSIGNLAFSYCTSLTSITIPNGVTSIGISAFAYCSFLTSVTLNPTTPPSLGDYDVFYQTSSNLQIYVPDESVDTYKAATNWSSYADKIKPISEKPV